VVAVGLVAHGSKPAAPKDAISHRQHSPSTADLRILSS
jgi:hypothetical protein